MKDFGFFQRIFFWRFDLGMVKYLSFLNSSFALRCFLINVNDKATVWHTHPVVFIVGTNCTLDVMMNEKKPYFIHPFFLEIAQIALLCESYFNSVFFFFHSFQHPPVNHHPLWLNQYGSSTTELLRWKCDNLHNISWKPS